MTHTGKRCGAHKYHAPRVTDCDWHHLVPLRLGGREEPENRIAVCQTGHRSIHVLFAMYEEHHGSPPWPIRREFGPGERKIAAEGWARYQESRGT